MNISPWEKKKIRQLADRLYTRIAEEKAGDLAEKFQIAQVVEEKVNCMDVAEVEEILLGVMKKELNAVVNLGALIGFCDRAAESIVLEKKTEMLCLRG